MHSGSPWLSWLSCPLQTNNQPRMTSAYCKICFPSPTASFPLFLFTLSARQCLEWSNSSLPMNTLSWMIKAWSDCQKQENVKKKKKKKISHISTIFSLLPFSPIWSLSLLRMFWALSTSTLCWIFIFIEIWQIFIKHYIFTPEFQILIHIL